MSTPLTYGSVCSGIEAATVAWHPLGFQPVFFAEIEPFCCELLRHHYPEVPNYGDFTRIKTAPAIDLLVAGTPCQDDSVAGLRAGLDGSRGVLKLEFAALAGRLRPRWILWEQPPGTLSINDGRDFGIFIGSLLQLGYGVCWRILDAQFTGVPQRRRRVFVVGYLGNWRPAAAVLFERDCLSRNPPPRRPSREEIAGTLGGGTAKHGAYDDTDRMTFVPDTAWALQERDHKGPDSDTKDGHLIVAFSAYDDGQGAAENLSPTLRVNGDTSSGQMAIAVRTAQTSANGHGIANEVAHTLDGAQQAVAFKPSHYTRDKDAGPSEVVSQTAEADKGDQDNVVLTFEARVGRNGRGAPSEFAPALKAQSGSTGRGAPLLFDPTQLTHPENRSRPQPGDPSHTLPAAGHAPTLVETLQPQGYDLNDASTYKTYADKVLRVLWKAIGAEAFAEWRSGIFDSLQTPEVLRPDLHGGGVRREADEARGGLDDGSLSRAQEDSERPVSEMRACGRARRSPQGRGFPEQQRRELDQTLSQLSHESAPTSTVVLALRETCEGSWVVQSSLHSLQGRPSVRRLTPKECERLMGFPDDYTRIKYRGKIAADGPRYRALGNSMAVPVMAWIGRRIQLVESILPASKKIDPAAHDETALSFGYPPTPNLQTRENT